MKIPAELHPFRRDIRWLARRPEGLHGCTAAPEFKNSSCPFAYSIPLLHLLHLFLVLKLKLDGKI